MSLVSYKRRAEGVKFEGEVFDRMDLRSMKGFGSTFVGCSFVNCDLDLTDWRASKFERCLFQNCSMRMVNFATSFLDDCLFTDSDLEQASFMGSHFRKGAFLKCRMAYGDVMFQDATVKTELVLESCNLHGSNLDFREVEPKSLQFRDCNLWAAKTSMGCAFWAGSIDQRMARQFLALVARASQDSLIAELAGDQYAVICRAMDGAKKGAVDSMTELPVTP